MGNVFAYARVSTPRQGEKGVSLQEQRSAIERYAVQRGLTITRWFEERESAAKSGRGEFTKMLRLIRVKAAQGVIIHKIDRSARNLEDWADLGKLVDVGAEIHFATENLDLRTVAGRLSADIQAVVAAHYSRNLREEAKKGFYGRLKQGFYPMTAPIGYLDQGAAKPKIHDPERAPLVREAFERYGSGTVSLPNLTRELWERGLRNRDGGKVSLNGVVVILKNPFYIGLIRIKRTGEMFPGNHEPLIEKSLFEQVQLILAGKRVDRVQNHIFTYSRIVRCRSCGYSLIGERKKGHAYYRCHNRPFKTPAVCPPTSIREEQIDEAVIATFKQVDLSDEELRVVPLLIEEEAQKRMADQAETEQRLKLQADQIEYRLSTLTDLLIDGALDRTAYEAKRSTLLFEQVRIREVISKLRDDSCPALAQLQKTVELAKSPSLLYKTAPVAKKRDLLKTLLSNLSVTSKDVEIMLNPAFRLIAERNKSTHGGAHRGTCRTWEQILNTLQEHLKMSD